MSHHLSQDANPEGPGRQRRPRAAELLGTTALLAPAAPLAGPSFALAPSAPAHRHAIQLGAFGVGKFPKEGGD